MKSPMRRSLRQILVAREEFLKLVKCFKGKLLKIPTKRRSLPLSICKRYSITARLILMKKANVERSRGSLKVGVELKRNVGLKR
jgi:hypothetical protein